MNKEFIPYELALELKELGFDEPCFGVYATKDGYVRKSAYDEIGDAPTYSQSFRWFREKHGLYSQMYIVRPFNATEEEYPEEVWIGQVCESDRKEFVNTDNGLAHNHFHTYEEAELACLKEMIKIVKNNYGKQ